MKDKIIDFIKKNRVSSTEVADCLGKTGAVKNIRALNRGKFSVGNIFWAYAHEGSNWDVHEQIQNVSDDDIVFVDCFNCGDKAIFGDLVSKYLLLYKGALAIVVNGNLRDVNRLIKENWPIWCINVNPEGCVNSKPLHALDESVVLEYKTKYDGAIAVCDDTGVVVIPKYHHNQEFLDRLIFIEEQEDTWYECIDKHKYSTFETVCLKKYELK